MTKRHRRYRLSEAKARLRKASRAAAAPSSRGDLYRCPICGQRRTISIETGPDGDQWAVLHCDQCEGEDQDFLIADDAVAYVLSPGEGAWLTNEDGVVAFESLGDALEASAVTDSEVETITMGELLEACRLGGTGCVLANRDGRAFVVTGQIRRYDPDRRDFPGA